MLTWRKHIRESKLCVRLRYNCDNKMTTLFSETPSNWYNRYKTDPFHNAKSIQNTPKQLCKEEWE